MEPSSGKNIAKDGKTQAWQKIYQEIVEPRSRQEVSVKTSVESKTTPLHWAVSVGCEEFVKIMLDKKATTDAADGDKSIPLYVAQQEIFSQISDFLSMSATKVKAKNEGGSESSPLNYGTKDGYHWLLLDDVGYIADVNAKDEHGRTSLHIALKERKKQIARLLFSSYEADVSAKDICGHTPLHYAVQDGFKEISTSLLEYGANINARDVNGKTPLHAAATTRCFWISSLLIENGADVNAIDRHGMTPMHHAVAQKKICKKMVEILLDAGSDVNIQDKQGCTPISIYFGKSNIYAHAKRYPMNVCELNHWYRPIIRLFRLHTIKLRAAGLGVKKKNIQPIKVPCWYTRVTPGTEEWTRNLYQDCRHHLCKCREELKKMKSIKLSAKVSLHDILITNNLRYKSEWDLERLSEEFPIYHSLLRNKFENNRKRLLLLEDGGRSFSSLLGASLPTELLEKIFSHLNYEDLQSLILCVADRQTK